MAGRETPLKGRKVSVWCSGEQLAEMQERDLAPSEVMRRGLLWQDDVAAPPDLQRALALIVRLAQALANGGRVTWPDQPPAVPGETG